MKIKLSRIAIVSTVIIMIGLSIFIGKNNKQEIIIKEINGEKSALGDVSIIAQDMQSIYKTSKSTINKDGISEEKFTKTTSTRYSNAQDLITNKELLDYSQGDNGTYQYDNYVGVVSVSTYYTEENADDEQKEIVATVMEENIETKEVKNYSINLHTYVKDNESNGISTTTVPIVFEDELYVVVGLDMINYNNTNKYENQTEESRLYVYKLNLKDKSAEHILTKKLSEDGESSIGYNTAFSKDSTAYFVNRLYSKNNKNETETEFQLLSFDLETRKFDTLSLGRNIDGQGLWNIFNYYLIDDIAYLIYDYELGKTFNISEIEINLNTNKITNKEIKYSLKLDENINTNDVGYSLDNLRCIDNKLFISLEIQNNTSTTWNSRGHVSQYIYVVDRDSKETLYAAKINNSKNNNITLSVVK
ncbi:hypothetical protein [Romboutsia sp. Marseille-P6047]|uniref:hypothetical protein n=1 Tax=Romboutsia sp. Marseille-P6047 TaxID=2161817 RepID=UPI000F06BB3A|nr:hypothetical protein [Romboutsia sp. Marseille-P6047]